MEVRRYRPTDKDQVASLIAQYRVFLSSLKSVSKKPDPEMARIELEEYLSSRYSIYVAVVNGDLLGYLVCRIDQNVVWAESLFVKNSARRTGVGSALYAEAERLTEELGGETVYNWVHPNNTGIILFLKKQGYDVLNLIEIRKPWHGEDRFSRMDVGGHQFKY